MRRRLPTALPVTLFWWAAATLRADPIIAAANGMVFHTEADCPALKKIEPANREVFKSIAEAESAGRRRCKLCEKLAAQRDRSKTRPIEREEVKSSPTSQPSPADFKLVDLEQVLANGDIVLKDGERIFPLGLSVPLAGQEGHEDAVAEIRRQLKSPIALGVPPLICERDEFGRRLGYLNSPDDAIDLGGALISAGLAWARRDCDHPLRSDYLQRELEAWQKGLGIWKRLEGEAGRAEVVVGRYARSYHAEGCPHTQLLVEPAKVPLNEAKARRLTACELYRIPALKGRKAEGPTSRRSSGKETRR